MITHKVANLVDELLDALIHQCNCFNTMGSGVAREIREKYPEAYNADCETKKGSLNKLGTFSYAKTGDGKIIYNLYSQYDYGYDGKLYTNYEAMKSGLKKICEHIKFNLKPNSKVGIPFRMGCTRGGGKWSEVINIITEIFENEPIGIVICEFKEYSQREENFKNKFRKAYKESDRLGLTDDYECSPGVDGPSYNN